MPSRIRPTLLFLLAAWLGAILFTASLVIAAQLDRRERQFDDEVRHVVGDLKNKLDTNEAVLAGFSAFLQAVDRGDRESAARYAASATAAYPHIYMMEVARKVPLAEEAAFEASLQERWRTDFRLKNFADMTGRQPAPGTPATPAEETWPILFMHPSLAETQAIYGLRLETVDYLASSLALAQRSGIPTSSPVFNLYEGGRAYILLQQVIRPSGTPSSEPNFFGSTMTAMLVIKAQALFPRFDAEADQSSMRFTAFIASPAKPESLLFEQPGLTASKLDQWFLPGFSRKIELASASQPMTMRFERQLLWIELLNPEMLTMLVLLGGALCLVPWLTIRHYRALDRAALEHERAAYLATHDLLTDLPNRFLFIDRFEKTFQHGQRNGLPFALLLIDLDHFKEVNDRFGHEIGDQVLVASGRRLVGGLRAGDTVARQGGDEFVALLGNIPDSTAATGVAEKLLVALAEPIATDAGPITISCSIGIALCPTHGESLHDLLKRADQAMYGAKEQGRNTVLVFTPAGENVPVRSQEPPITK
ncbi:sensor domain-containing diguanylate cyclase [Dechloromonas sp. A34]|uniref:sensor domain-containing diguanylate cyclase n=1 Tax=Dechloromonas sp. A34 TaxID=447588 RepID=UPI0022491F4C|nr:sensor domain-containing diguanylate cyclase [Dechloromonas sp. A34]